MNKKDTQLLATIVVSHASDPGYHMVTEKQVANLTENGYAEINFDISEGNKFAVRATQKGINEVNANTRPAPALEAESSQFAIIEGAVLPKGRLSRKSSIYPFAAMDIGQSFFVANTEERPHAAKSMASTVSSANGRSYADGLKRRFSCKSVQKGGVYGDFTAPEDGALIQRIQLKEESAEA